MNRIKKLLIVFFTVTLVLQINVKAAPTSFADLAERLMPSVVNISTTTTVTTNANPFPGFQFPPGSPFEDMFKEFGTPQKRKSAALGSGFIIDEKGIVITNNHVIKDSEDIVVRVGGDKEYKAKLLGQTLYLILPFFKLIQRKNLYQLILETLIKRGLEIGLLQSVIHLG